MLPGDGEGGFGAAESYPTGAHPGAVVTGDFNGDGDTDVATADYSAATVTVLLNTGSGGLGPASPNAVDGKADALATGDFDADGNLDIVVGGNADGTSGRINVLRGVGDGTFEPAVTYYHGSNRAVSDIAAADVDGDGKTDVVTANFGRQDVTVLLNEGDGTFPEDPAEMLHVQLNTATTAVEAADLDDDGDEDLLLGGNSSGVAVLEGAGDGSFEGPTWFDGPGQSWDIDVADVNGDGNLDATTQGYGTGEVAVLPGNGDGTFTDTVSWPVDDYMTSVLVRDFDADGKADIASSSATGAKVHVQSNATPFPAVVATGSASDVTAAGATVTATVTPRESATTWHIEYGPSAAYGSSTAGHTIAASATPEAVSAVLGSLSPGTEYHYRVVATNDAGTVRGADRTFTTASLPAEQPPVDTNPPAPTDPGNPTSPVTSPAPVAPPALPTVGEIERLLAKVTYNAPNATALAAAGLSFKQRYATAGTATSTLEAPRKKAGKATALAAKAPAVLGKTVTQIKAAGTYSIRVKLSKSGKAALKRKRLKKVVLRTSFVDGAGRRSVTTTTIALKK